MLLGAALVPVGLDRFLAAAAPAPHRSAMLAEGLLILGGLIAFALAVGMSGFVWSLLVEKRHPSLRVAGTHAIRILVFIVLFSPIVIGSF
ncbi:hypothetical protein [Massilia sp. X63]|jgi:hypothetical protein|uniref:hypothetical protein n=1 Tax=Massilia sp. X63 TaxID=3237285 RepID=UPI0034DD7CE9